MKIALVILHADTARGGAERYTLDLATGLVGRGHLVSLLASSFQSGETAGQRVVLPATGATRSRRYLSFLNSLDRELDRTKYDLVHAMLPVRRCDLYHPHAGIAVEALAKGHLNKSGAVRQTLSWVGNQCNSRRRLFAKVEMELIGSPKPSIVLSLSRLIQEVVRRNYPGLAEDRCATLFNGIDLNRFDPAVCREDRQAVRGRFQIADSSIVGLLLAQDFERKGVRQAIEALAKVSDRRVVLLIGGRPDPTKYRHLAESLRVQDRVIFSGPVANPAAFYRAADFFVLPTRFDPCSLVVLEALAMGLPVISSNRNGACEIMRQGEHGYILSNPDDVPSLAVAMRDLLDPEVRSRMSNACLELRPRLSQDWHLEQLEAVYTAIAKSPNHHVR